MVFDSLRTIRKSVIVVLLVTGSMEASTGGTKTEPSPNCVLITVDTLRADHVSRYSAESPVETTAMLTRNYTSGDIARVIWRGHLTDVALVPDLREYMKRLAQSYEGR